MWRNPEPRKFYDVIIVGGGGHGLGTAYYLAKEHGLKNIAVIDHSEINPHILMKHDDVVIDSNVLEQIKQATIL